MNEIQALFHGKSCSEQLTAAADYLDEHPDQASLDLCCFFSLPVFCMTYFEERLHFPFGKHHGDIFNAIQHRERGLRINILAPRGSAKSTLICFFLPLHLIYFKEFYEEFYGFGEQVILFLSRSSDLTEQRVGDIKREIETNSAFSHLVGETWRTRHVETANGVHLLPRSIGSKDIRGGLVDGYRYSLIIADDLDDMESLDNPRVIEKEWRWFTQDLLPSGQPKTNFLLIDTVKGERSISNRLFSLPGWENHRISAIERPAQLVHPEAEELWQEYRTIFTDLTIPAKERDATCDHFLDTHPEMLDENDIQEVWNQHPELTYRFIREYEFKWGRQSALMEFQNLLRDEALSIFDMRLAVRFKIEDGVIKRSDDRQVQMDKIVGGVAFLDWAGQKDLETRAFAAVVGMFFENVGEGNVYAYCYSVWLDRGSRGFQFRALLEAAQGLEQLFASYGIDVPIEVYVEDVVDTTGDIKPHFEDQYNLVATDMDMDYPLYFLPRHKNKHERIHGLEAPVNNGHVAFNYILPVEFEDQMSRYPVAEYFDGPDALQGAWEVKPTEHPDEREAARQRAQRRVDNSRVLRL